MYRHLEALAEDCWSGIKSGCCDQPWAWAGRKSTLQIASSSALGTSASEPRSSRLHGKYLGVTFLTHGHRSVRTGFQMLAGHIAAPA